MGRNFAPHLPDAGFRFASHLTVFTPSDMQACILRLVGHRYSRGNLDLLHSTFPDPIEIYTIVSSPIAKMNFALLEKERIACVQIAMSIHAGIDTVVVVAFPDFGFRVCIATHSVEIPRYSGLF